MNDRQLVIYAQAVANLAAEISSSESDQPQARYTHIGALLADAVLQAGLNYRTVVAPRVNRLIERFPKAITTPAFREVLGQFGPACVLQWSNSEKPRRLLLLTEFLYDNCVFTTTAFRGWLLEDRNCEQIAAVRGVGPKTIDYLKCLCGIDAVAVDRHIRNFVARAGVHAGEYEVVKAVVEQAAELLGMSKSHLDRLIWSSESGGSSTTEEPLTSIAV